MSEPRTEIRPQGGVPRPATALSSLVSAANELEGVRRSELAPGDRLLVSTRNSIYTLVARDDGRFAISGGLYSREGRDGDAITVNGCTAGGRAIFTSIVAAPGLFLERGDGTVTTRIRRVRRIPASSAA